MTKGILDYAILCTIIMMILSVFNTRRVFNKELIKSINAVLESNSQQTTQLCNFWFSPTQAQEIKDGLGNLFCSEQHTHISYKIQHSMYWFSGGKATIQVSSDCSHFNQLQKKKENLHTHSIFLKYRFDHETSRWIFTQINVILIEV